MRPWTQPERQLKREKQNCSWTCLLPIIPFFSKKGKKKNICFRTNSVFLRALFENDLKWWFSSRHSPNTTGRSCLTGGVSGSLPSVRAQPRGRDKQARMTKNSELMEPWLNVEDAQIRFSDWLRARIPGFRWSNPDSGTAGSTESKYRVSQIKFDQCGETVVEQFGERKHFSSRFTSPKQTAAAGAQQPVVSAVCCRAAVSHLAVLAVFFSFLLSWRNADVCSFLFLRSSGFSGNNLQFKCNYGSFCMSLGPLLANLGIFNTGLMMSLFNKK